MRFTVTDTTGFSLTRDTIGTFSTLAEALAKVATELERPGFRPGLGFSEEFEIEPSNGSEPLRIDARDFDPED